jgi:hypothetical protein
MQIATDQLENPFQYPGIKEKGWSEIEAESILLEGRTAAANAGQPLDNMNANASPGEQKCGGKTSRPRPYYHYFSWWLAGREMLRLVSGFAAGER